MKFINKMRESIIIIVAFLFTIQGCTQKNKAMITQNPTITADNIVEGINKQIKHYPEEIIYKFRFESYYCHFEIFINDIPVYKNFAGSMTSSAFDINPYIFKSGTQKLTYKMYPIGKVENEQEYNEFRDITYLQLTLKSYDLKNENKDDVTYNEYKTPDNIVKDEYGNETKKFIAEGKDYYEGSFMFEAKVPYELDSFENAQDLRKTNPKTLEAQLIKQYATMKNMYQNKEYDNIARTSFDKLKNEYISTYENKDEIKKAWDAFIEGFKNPKLEMQPIENYKMVFFADGKLVALMQNTNDNRLKGSTALWGKVQQDGKTRVFIAKNYFYIPHGKTEFEVY